MSKDKLFHEIYTKAYQAGIEAGNELEHDGWCGFAWVNIKPANSAFANYLRKKGYGRTDSYYGGLTVWIGEFGQSVDRKYEFAKAFAEVVRNEVPTLKNVQASQRLD